MCARTGVKNLIPPWVGATNNELDLNEKVCVCACLSCVHYRTVIKGQGHGHTHTHTHTYTHKHTQTHTHTVVDGDEGTGARTLANYHPNAPHPLQSIGGVCVIRVCEFVD